MDEGSATSYLLLAKDTPVYTSERLVAGTVKEVLSDPARDIFDGLVISSDDGERFLAADRVAAIHEQGVDIALTYAQVRELPSPPAHRRVRYDLARDERPWIEVLRWLVDHIGHLFRHGDPRIARARQQLAARDKALKLARENPRLALAAGVGRPDVAGAFHGGVIDINHAPAEAIASLPSIDLELARRVVAAREAVDGFSSLEDFGSVLDLPGDMVEQVREHVVFLPR